jgi:hypothetical protein
MPPRGFDDLEAPQLTPEGAETGLARRRLERLQEASPWPRGDVPVSTLPWPEGRPPNRAKVRQDEMWSRARIEAELNREPFDPTGAERLSSDIVDTAAADRLAAQLGADVTQSGRIVPEPARNRIARRSDRLTEAYGSTDADRFARSGIDRWREDRARWPTPVNEPEAPRGDNAGIHAVGSAGLGGLALWLYGAIRGDEEYEEPARTEIPDFDPADPAVDLETYRDTPFYRPVESLPPYGGAEPAGGSAPPILTAPGGVEGPFAVDLEQWSPERIAAVFGEQGEEEALVAPDSRFFRHEEIDDANEVRDIQERINETEYGPIEVDGSAKDETWGAIGRVAAGYGAPKPASLTDAYPLILGARQEPLDVRDIQTVLMRDPASAEIMEGWGADGDYGPLTERALETAFPGYDAPPNTREPTPDELMEIWRSRLMRRRAP